MAAAEARAAWQRAANRCIVQEDAKRAPKLPPCCSSSSSSAPNSDTNNAPPNPNENNIHAFTPLNWNPTSMMNTPPILPPDTKWWLQLQPSFTYQKDFTCEQINLLEDELGQKKVDDANVFAVPSTESSSIYGDDPGKREPTFEEHPWMVSTAFMKQGCYEKRVVECQRNEGKPLEDPFVTKKKKGEPWWRISDEDELAYMVAQKATEQLENCDLPRPAQKVPVCRDPPLSCVETLDTVADYDGLFSSPLSKMYNPVLSQPLVDCAETHRCPGAAGQPFYNNDKDFRCDEKDCGESKSRQRRRVAEEEEGSNRGRAELLEALCHSQTRAREAEMAAKKAYSEKEDIIKLLFRQASHLFACKQWLKMLQIENLCLQLRIINDHHFFPLHLFPLTPRNNKKHLNKPPPLRHNKRKIPDNHRRHNYRSNICRYAFVFAVGLGLVGAGLLLGWTFGWLFPTF